jgi:diguanylate cyclase (GGDEF)-like protein
MVLEYCSVEDARKKAEEIREALEKLDIDFLRVTASFGVATLKQEHKDFDALLKDADDALYKAKESGRNKVVVA